VLVVEERDLAFGGSGSHRHRHDHAQMGDVDRALNSLDQPAERESCGAFSATLTPSTGRWYRSSNQPQLMLIIRIVARETHQMGYQFYSYPLFLPSWRFMENARRIGRIPVPMDAMRQPPHIK